MCGAFNHSFLVLLSRQVLAHLAAVVHHLVVQCTVYVAHIQPRQLARSSRMRILLDLLSVPCPSLVLLRLAVG
eukprot:SAG22_NODE_9389_length_592_cov_1.042596_1_plen_72_part_10